MGSKNGKPVLRDEDVIALSQSSGMTKEDVRESFNAFIAEHPNGKMKPKDFREIMSSALPKKDASKMEKHVFRVYDINNDGHVDFVEFMVVYFILSEGTPEEVLKKIFRLFDVNSDGTITVSFNCGENAPNNIDTQGNDFTFTSRHYGVNPKVINSAKDPIISALKAQ